jgi:hypothetical protein
MTTCGLHKNSCIRSNRALHLNLIEESKRTTHIATFCLSIPKSVYEQHEPPTQDIGPSTCVQHRRYEYQTNFADLRHRQDAPLFSFIFSLSLVGPSVGELNHTGSLAASTPRGYQILYV